MFYKVLYYWLYFQFSYLELSVIGGDQENVSRVTNLLPCPFCGGEASPTVHLSYSWFAPVCKSCGVRGPSVRIERGLDQQKLRELMDKADDLWNTRYPHSPT
jgi:Lar family restriction alleviation protein